MFEVNLTSALHSASKAVAAGESSVIVTDLQPNTQYQVTVTIVTHGAARITSLPALATTQDGGNYLQLSSSILCGYVLLSVCWSVTLSALAFLCNKIPKN